MIVEIRTYKTKPGKRSEFLQVFHSKSIPAHVQIGMKPSKIPIPSFLCAAFLACNQFYEERLWKDELSF